MPNIQTYDNKVEAPRADSAGSEAYEIEGRHIEESFAVAGQAIGRGLGQVGEAAERHEEIQDTSANSKAGAAAFVSLSDQLNKAATAASADPDNADKHFADFQQSLDDTLGNIGNDAVTDKGRDNAIRIQDTLRDEFTRQGLAAQSSIVGQQVVNNLTQTKNNLSQAVSNNPTLLDTALSYLHGTLKDQLDAHSLKAEDQARINQEFGAPAARDLAISAFTTMAERNPAAARDALTSGTFANMFGAEDIKTMTAYANAQEKAATEADKAATEKQRQADSDAFKATTSQLAASYIQPDGSLRVPPGAPQQIVKAALMAGAEPGEIRSLMDMTKTIIKDQAAGNKPKTDPGTYELFSKKLLDGNLSDQEVYQARVDGTLSDKDTSFFLTGSKRLAADPALKDAEKQFNTWVMAQKPAFTHSTNLLGVGSDPVGAQKFNQFQQAAHDQFMQLYNSKGDWQGALRANNPGYLGKMAPAYMSNIKGASLPPPKRFTSDSDVVKFLASKPSPNTPFIGPDGKTYYTKGH